MAERLIVTSLIRLLLLIRAIKCFIAQFSFYVKAQYGFIMLVFFPLNQANYRKDSSSFSKPFIRMFMCNKTESFQMKIE